MELEFHNFHIDNPSSIPGLATKLLVMLTNHVKTLATGYFTGMLSLPQPGVFSSYIPCWKCFAEIGSAKDLASGELQRNNKSHIEIRQQCIYNVHSKLYCKYKIRPFVMSEMFVTLNC